MYIIEIVKLTGQANTFLIENICCCFKLFCMFVCLFLLFG